MRKRFAAVLAVLFSINLALLPVVDAARPLGDDPARATTTSSTAAPAAAKRNDAKRDKGDRNKRRKDRTDSKRGSLPLRTNIPGIRSGVVRQPAGRMTTAAEQGERYIVVFRNKNTDSQAVLDELMAATPGIEPTHVYGYLVSGFAAYLTSEAKQEIERDPRVASVEPDVELELIDPLPTGKKATAARSGARSLTTEQTIPNGISRVGATMNTTAKINGVDERVNADVGIIDSGVDLGHPDLNVFSNMDCTPNTAYGGNDQHGHGTHVAGTAAALDNGVGVVGVAPGARIWSYRVMDDGGQIWNSYVLLCLEWATWDTTNPYNGQTLDVANMSIGGNHSDGSCASTSYHSAVCDAVAAGLTIIAAAGNDAKDASGTGPATYEEVITVSNMADKDGKPGGMAGQFSRLCSSSQERDDGLASTSNFGADIDIAAPGIDVLSTVPRYLTRACSPATGYAYLSGTSMAAPHVAGAAALIKARNPSYTPAQVKKALLDTRHIVPLAGDPDGINEGVLYVGPKDTTRPSVSISTIGGGAGNGVTVNASDAGSGISRVELGYCLAPKKPKKRKKGKKPKKPKACEFFQAKKIGADSLAPYEFVWDPLPAPGSYHLLAWALDGTGNGQVARVAVTVSAAQGAAKRSVEPKVSDASVERRDNDDANPPTHDLREADGDETAENGS